MKRLSLCRVLTGGVASVVLLGACGSDATGGESASGSHGDAHEFAELFAGYSADFEPVATPAELEALSDLVVTGRIESVAAGPEDVLQEEPAIIAEYVVVDIAVEAVLHGTPPDGFGDHVYLKLPSPGGVDAEVFEAHAPVDEDLVLYAIMEPPETPGIPVQNPDAGRPAGQPLVVPTNPQGFVIVSEAESLVQILEQQTITGADLASLLPDSERFPYDPNAPHE